jgi:hypothetical protein
MKKVLSTAVLCALLTLSFFFAGCKNSVSSGGEYNPPEKKIPLTLEVIEDGEITFNNLDKIGGLKYIINDNNSVEITETSGSKSISVSAGDVITLFAKGTSNTDSHPRFGIDCSSDCYVYGNIMSLLTDNFQNETTITQSYAFAFLFYKNIHIKNHSEKNIVLPATTLKEGCYYSMFNRCTLLTEAPVLPATTLANDCYNGMFYGCSSLTKAPNLPATSLEPSCYYNMFIGCSSLTEAPDLPATNLEDGCYGCMFESCTSITKAPELPATFLKNFCYVYMFWGCTSLTEAPALPATTLTMSCYSSMFRNCSSLKKVECLATDISAQWFTDQWLDGVASDGIFIKASGVDWPTGKDGIPSGWTVQEK